MVVVFSGRVNKWNKYWIKQERVIVVSNKNIYNFHKKSIFLSFLTFPLTEVRRMIEISSLAGLTKSLHEKSCEFVIHVTSDYDYRMEAKE